jgi:hypothetical protein
VKCLVVCENLSALTVLQVEKGSVSVSSEDYKSIKLDLTSGAEATDHTVIISYKYLSMIFD